jgi:hypothetical protein
VVYFGAARKITMCVPTCASLPKFICLVFAVLPEITQVLPVDIPHPIHFAASVYCDLLVDFLGTQDAL